MNSSITIQNNLPSPITVSTSVSPGLSQSYWGVSNNTAGAEQSTPILWMSRTTGITDHHVWTFSTSFTVAGVAVQVEEQLTGTTFGSDITISIVAGDQNTGWSGNDPIAVTFTGTDGNDYRIAGTYVSEGLAYDNVQFSVSRIVLSQIKNVVVLMMENRSFDNLLGWIYGPGNLPRSNIPPQNPTTFTGLTPETYFNTDAGVNNGRPVYASEGTSSWIAGGQMVQSTYVPDPDPGEEFGHVNTQIAGNMGGFLTDYVPLAGTDTAAQIMQSYSPAQVPVLSTLATSFAVSDAWHASVPSQTWPNRGFLQTGSSDGYTNNNNAPWNITTIFDVLSSQNIDWMVYNDGALLSLTKAMFFGKYWDNETNFKSISDFEQACQAGTLPPFTFLEPSFGPLETDESYHPPFDITPGEEFLSSIYRMISSSPNRDEILFVVLFDEHGGTYDHVEPPGGAAPPMPGPVATDGTGFTFDRFGVRVPAIVISSYVTPGSVFRSATGVPFDHTSILATVRDWLGLGASFGTMLPSPRIATAPTLGPILNQTTPQPWAAPPTPPAEAIAALATRPLPDDSVPLNHNQRAILVATAAKVAGRPYTQAERAIAFQRLKTHGDARTWIAALQPHLPLK